MLNELADLSRSLTLRGILPPVWHDWVKPFKKGEALVAELGVDGGIARASLLSKDEVAGLRNITPDNQSSFPGFNLNCPLLALADASLWNQAPALSKLAPDTAQSGRLALQPKDLRRIRRLIGEYPRQELEPRLIDGGPILDSTMAVLQRLRERQYTPDDFVRELALQIVKSGESGRLPQDMTLDLLFGKPNKEKASRDPWQITLILDVADLDRFSHRVADPAVAFEWSARLIKSNAAPTEAGTEFICGISGRSDSPIGKKMPEPNLPILGRTYLLSMNKDVPCQTRYGKTSTSIFPMGRSTIQKLKDALLYFTHDSRRGKTWNAVPNGSSEKPDLLIAYLEEEPESELPVVGLLADAKTDPMLESEMYEKRTEQIYLALRLLGEQRADVHLRVIALSAIDKGRKQVVFSGRYSAVNILDGRRRWLSGAANVPTISVPLPAERGKSIVWRSGYAPTPYEAMYSFKKQWIRAGSANCAVPGVDLGRIYQLLLEPDAKSQAVWLLERYLPLTIPLLVGLSRPFASEKERKKTLPEAARREALVIIGLYGILLLLQGRNKETYMESRDYLLGQFLQMTDLLHKLYCKHERKNSIPPQLIGNAAISMAMQSPRRALQVLPTRMAVYLAWADRFSGQEDVGLVKWARKELGRISAVLKDQNLETGVTSSGKAELLLGYLARPKETDKQEGVSA